MYVTNAEGVSEVICQFLYVNVSDTPRCNSTTRQNQSIGYYLEKAQVVGIVGIVGMVGMVGTVGINK